MFLKLISQAAKSINENRVAISKALFIPFIAYLFLILIGIYIEEPYVAFFAGLLTYSIDTVIAVTIHRLVLLGPNTIPEWGLLKWSMRETIFILHVIGMWLFLGITWGILGVAGVALGSIAGPLAIFGVIAALVTVAYIWGKLSLVFPSIAIDKKISFNDSWKLADGHEGLMILVIAVLPLFLFIPIGLGLLLYSPSSMEDLETFNFTVNTISTLATPFYLIFSIALLSVTYKYISDEKAKASIENPETTPPDEPESIEPGND